MAWGPSWEVALMAELVGRDARTTTSANLRHISTIKYIDCASEDWGKVKMVFSTKEVPEKEGWWTLC